MALRQNEKRTSKMKCRIKTGDEVIVIAGKDKGKQGEVIAIRFDRRTVKLKINGVNEVKKHVKANPQQGVEGGIIAQEAFLDVSNVKIFNSATGKGDKVTFKKDKDNRNARVFKSTGEFIEATK